MEDRLKKILRELGLPPGVLTPLAGDASERRFFRVARPGGGARTVLVVFPEGTAEDELVRYTGTAHLLREAGLPVPGVYRRSEEALLVEDCGDLLLQEAVQSRDHLPLYREAVDLILEMQDRVPAAGALNPPFDEAKFLWELDFFLTHTISGFFGEKVSAAGRREWRALFTVLAREPLTPASVFCHRDFHSRNLLLQEGRLRIIDFQDGRAGPPTYDLVSLLEDPYISLSPGLRAEMKSRFFAGRGGDNFSGDFKRGYDIMALQRLLKAAGTFGFQAARRGKKLYAAYLPAALKRAAEIMAGYPEFDRFRKKLEKYRPAPRSAVLKIPATSVKSSV